MGRKGMEKKFEKIEGPVIKMGVIVGIFWGLESQVDSLIKT